MIPGIQHEAISAILTFLGELGLGKWSLLWFL